MRVFTYIARRYNSGAESTSLLSSVASLANTFNNATCLSGFELYSRSALLTVNHYKMMLTIDLVEWSDEWTKLVFITDKYSLCPVKGNREPVSYGYTINQSINQSINISSIRTPRIFRKPVISITESPI